MEFEYGEGTIYVLLVNPNARDLRRVNLQAYCSLRPEDANKILTATAAGIRGKKYNTQVNYFQGAVEKFGAFLARRQIHQLPTTSVAWQFLLTDWFAWHLSNNDYTAVLTTRLQRWTDPILPWLNLLIDEGVVPYGIVIPSANIACEIIELRSPRNPDLLGERPAKKTELNKPINKTIAGPIFWRTEVEYLDEVETLLRERNQLVTDALNDHWVKLVRDFRIGKNLMRQVPDELFSWRKGANNWHDCLQPGADKRTVVTHPKMPNSLGWTLRIKKDMIETGSEDNCWAPKRLLAHPGLSYLKRDRASSSDLLTAHTLTPHQRAQYSLPAFHARFVGVLTPIDVAVACAILIQEHPNLTPGSISTARILNARGKTFLLTTDVDARKIFSVDKPRAGKRKYAALSVRAQRVIRHVIRATDAVRTLLRRAGSKQWRHLFVGFSPGAASRFGHPGVTALLLNSNENRAMSLVRLYPHLLTNGLGPGTFDLKKLRTTQGLLEWFKTGSMQEVSRKLGNSYRVAVEHYIPASLVRLWNERIIRRMQNTFIVLAAYQEDYLLDVTDIRTMADLQSFLVQLLFDFKSGTSPVADDIQKKFGSRIEVSPDLPGNDVGSENSGALLSLNLDANALTLLYTYQSIALNELTAAELDTPDSETGLIPKRFVDLAALLMHAAESETIGESLRECLNHGQLKASHATATARLPSVLNDLSKIKIRAQWK